jgi:hypothetical protein
LKKQKLKKEKKTEIRISGLWKLFSRLDSNFQKPERPHQTGRSFQKKIHVLGKIEAGECPQNTKETMDACFTLEL